MRLGRIQWSLRVSSRIAWALVAAFALSLLPFAASAAAPQVKTQAPGFYRMMLGSYEITALSDGVFGLETRRLLSHAEPDIMHGLLEQSFHQETVPTSVNVYLINTGDQLILVDTGAAKRFGPTLGHLLANLIASGYRPEQVDTILITHMHPDHIGGMVSDGEMVFPNATVRVERREAEFWLSESALESAAVDRKEFFAGAAVSMAPYASAGRVKTFDAPAALAAGIRAVPAPGHTPGHTIYSIESEGQRLVLWGDLTEVASIQFALPTVTIAFDSDAAETVRQRGLVHADAARGRHLVAAAHLPFPGIGHVSKKGTGYSWVPIDWDDVR